MRGAPNKIGKELVDHERAGRGGVREVQDSRGSVETGCLRAHHRRRAEETNRIEPREAQPARRAHSRGQRPAVPRRVGVGGGGWGWGGGRWGPPGGKCQVTEIGGEGSGLVRFWSLDNEDFFRGGRVGGVGGWGGGGCVERGGRRGGGGGGAASEVRRGGARAMGHTQTRLLLCLGCCFFFSRWRCGSGRIFLLVVWRNGGRMGVRGGGFSVRVGGGWAGGGGGRV